MDTYVILKDLAIIIVFAKLFGILARKCKAPQVVGELIAGIVTEYGIARPPYTESLKEIFKKKAEAEAAKKK